MIIHHTYENAAHIAEDSHSLWSIHKYEDIETHL